MESIKILQHNVCNWNTNKHILTNTYKNLNPDVILINSHGLKSNENIKIHSYSSYTINSSNELNDGSAILIKQNLKHKIKDNFDTDVIQLTIETNTGPINIATTYLPPRRPYLPFTDFHNLASQHHPTYIIGDLNAHHPYLNTKTTNKVGKALKILIDNNKVNFLGPNFPTYLSHNAASTPDIILGNNKTYHNITILPGPTTASDHIPVIFTITSQAIKIPVKPKLNLKLADWEKYKVEIENKTKNFEIDENMQKDDLERSMKNWINIITEAIENNIPKSTNKLEQKEISNPQIKYLQWICSRILDNSRLTGWTHSKYTAYKTAKQKLVEESRTQSLKNWENKMDFLHSIYNDPKKFWQNIKRLRGITTSSTTYLISQNNKIYEDKDKEPIYRHIWSNIFKISPEENQCFDPHTDTLVNNYITENQEHLTPYTHANPNNLDNTNKLTAKITIQEVNNILKQLKNNTPGHTNINKTILQNLPHSALIKFTALLNVSLSMGLFPNCFKHAKIKLLPKPNKPSTDPINYRPISLLEVPGKIFEKIINQRLRFFLEQNNCLPNSQHGFRQNRSTDTAIAITTEAISNAARSKTQCCLIMRDVSKAFDKVWHNGLKYKISNLRLPTIITKLLCNFIDNRTASISLNTYDGPSFPIHSGVPQGSCISPTLYIIYTSDIPPQQSQGINISYADDITQIILQPGKSRQMLARRIEREATIVNNFEHKWKIKTNTTKFNILPIAIKKTSPVTLNNQVIEYGANANILGLHITRQGFSKHINKIKQKASIALSTLTRFRQLKTNIKLHLVKACILPILTYPAYPLNSISKAALLSLQRIQNKSLRYAFNEKYPYTKTCKQLHEIAKVQPINTTLYDRGNKIKHKLIHKLKDPIYTNLIANDDNNEDHTWFKRPIVTLNKDRPAPLYT